MNQRQINLKAKILEVSDILRNQAEYADNYKKQQIEIQSNKTYSQEYQNERIAELRSLYIEKYNETKTKVIEKLNAVINTEKENEAVFDCGSSEYANTINMITSSSDKLSPEVINAIKLKFAGQYLVLNSIRSVFKHCGVDVDAKPYCYSEFTKKAEEELAEVIILTENAEQEETTAMISLRNIFRKLIRFGEVRGITFSEEERTFSYDMLDEEEEIRARKSMGLSE